jgi:AraC family transcriptional regulator
MSSSREKISGVHHLHTSGEIGFGIVTYRPRGTCGPVQQGDWQLVVIHRGLMVRTSEGRKQTVEEGQGILLEPGHEEYLEFSRRQETVHSWCRFPRGLAPAPFSFPSGVCGKPAACSPWLLDFMRRGWKLSTEIETREGRHRMFGLVLAAMWDFCGAFSKSSKVLRPLPASLLKAQAAMESRLAESFSLSELAAWAAVSKGYLIKLAHEYWHTTPIEHLWQLRLEEAARLLRETGLGIAEVAYRTGFANPYHFSRRFRQRFGRHPRAWRSAIWGG